MTLSQPSTLVATLQEWLSIDSTSGDEREFLEHLEAYFTARGWSVERQDVEPQRWNLIISGKETPRVFFSTHVDTVPPFLPVRYSGDAVHGRGACDTKGGLLAMAHAAERLRDEGIDDIGFLLVVGEEVDHCGARAAQELEIQPERIILCEPTENKVVRAQKGMLKFELRASGTAGHSAFPECGQSAVEPLLDALQRLREATWPSDHVLGPTTFNVGVIEAGVAANVFAPSARAELLVRAVSPIGPLLTHVENLLGEEITMEKVVFNDPVFFDPPDDVETCTVPFNTDATYLQKLAPVWLVGPGDIRVAHSDDEFIGIQQLGAGIDLYCDLARRALAE